MPGIFALETPSDLLAKLAHDLERLRAKKDDRYAAFDFFITAEHLLDWMFPDPDGKATRRAARDDNTILAVVSHIASAAKHYDGLAAHHNLVEQALPTGRYFAGSYFGQGGYGEGYFGVSTLVVQLTGKAAAELGARIPALDLAERVFAFWQKRLGAGTAA